jgi:hypothetical protein
METDHNHFSFDPDRWINPTKEMKESFMPFGGGSRSEYFINRLVNILSPSRLTFLHSLHWYASCAYGTTSRNGAFLPSLY